MSPGADAVQLSDLLSAVQALGYSSDTQAQQVQFINDTYREVCGQKRWPFLEAQDSSISTVTGVPGYSLSAITPGISRMDAVRIQQSAIQAYWNTDYKEPQYFRDLENMDRTPGIPQFWTVINQQLRFYPVPDGIYNVLIDYIVEVTPLVATTDVPLLPTDYHDLLVWGAIRSIAFRERDWLGRQFSQTEFEQRLGRMNDEYLLRQRQSESHVKHHDWNENNLPYPFYFNGGY